jgi:zinc protease
VAALALLTDILGGGIDSRLDRALVRDGKFALAAGAGADLLRRGPGMLYLSATPAPGVPLQTVEATVESVLDALRRDGVTPEEMARSLQRLTGGEAYDRDSLTGLANRIGRGRMVGQSLADMAGEDDLLRSLTVADVNRAAQVLLPTAFVTTHLLPKPAL